MTPQQIAVCVLGGLAFITLIILALIGAAENREYQRRMDEIFEQLHKLH